VRLARAYNPGTMQWIYLDNNATTQPAPEVVDAMNEVLREYWANPSSVHRFGQAVRQRVELARSSVARLINCRERDLIFTSGGTESNNLALRGTLLGADVANNSVPRVLITTPIEHSAVREPADDLTRAGVKVVRLGVDRDGWIDPASLAAALHEHAVPGSLTLVSIHWANNETGVIEPIDEMMRVVAAFRMEHADRHVLFHTDATQAVGKLPVDVAAVPVDLLTMSAHKWHGPKGVGALYVRRGVRLTPQLRGGPQERERRGGTENTTAIIGMGVAAELARAFLEDEAAIARLRQLRDRFEEAIVAAIPDAVVHSASDVNRARPHGGRLWNTSNIGFPRLEAEAILLGLSERGVCASAGAACSSGSLEPSPVLLAMGIDETIAHGSVRFSLSRYTTEEEIAAAITIVPEVVNRIARTLPV